MSNLVVALRTTVERMARKELKRSLKSMNLKSMRKDITDLKRIVAEQRKLMQVGRSAGADTPTRGGRAAVSGEKSPDTAGVRMSAKSIRSHRTRLGLSQKALAQLAGVTPVAVYLWESGRTHPRGRSLAALADIRKLGPREAGKRLEAMADAEPEPKRRGRPKGSGRKVGGRKPGRPAGKRRGRPPKKVA